MQSKKTKTIIYEKDDDDEYVGGDTELDFDDNILDYDENDVNETVGEIGEIGEIEEIEEDNNEMIEEHDYLEDLDFITKNKKKVVFNIDDDDDDDDEDEDEEVGDDVITEETKDEETKLKDEEFNYYKNLLNSKGYLFDDNKQCFLVYNEYII